MEIVLNLCWLALVVAAFGLWLRQPQFRGRALQHTLEWAAAAVVLACVLVLIFPIISASDDVRTAREFLEEPTSEQPLAKNLEVHKRLPLGVLPTPVAALAQPQAFFGALRPLGIVYVAAPLARHFEPLRPAPGRSPPQA
ncbi:MAG TPA: hypothetical protein VE825_09860 [Terriglobales bacterium]|jgi:hypothetical protein|nr:hypothetical protein [Terriglobales bacterium]